MELPAKLLIGATGFIFVVILAAIDPTILILVGLLGVLGIILALVGGRAETEATLATIMKTLRQSMRLVIRTVYGA